VSSEEIAYFDDPMFATVAVDNNKYFIRPKLITFDRLMLKTSNMV